MKRIALKFLYYHVLDTKKTTILYVKNRVKNVRKMQFEMQGSYLREEVNTSAHFQHIVFTQ